MAVISAVAYARYSSDKQQESSITVQLAAIRKFCMSHNIEIIHEYVDEAQTGTNANRKDFQEMVRAAPDKNFQLIVVHRMDRWARNVDDARYYKKYFAKYGIKMISSIEEFDETPEGEFFELMSMGMAELYSKKLSREATAGILANARQGKIHGGLPPLGYKKTGKYYTIDEKGAEAVRIIFDMVKQGYGYSTIRNYLNSNGYRRVDGELFRGGFTDLLRNRKYIGEYIFNRSAYRARGVPYNSHSQREENEIIRIPGGMPRIVDDETFYKVQRILDSRVRTSDMRELTDGRKSHKKKYLLTGAVRCGECGRSFCGMPSKSNGNIRFIYRCSSKNSGCSARAVSMEYLDEYILALLKDCIFEPQNEERLLDMVKASYIRSYDKLENTLTELERSIKETEEAIKEQEQLMTNSESRILKNIARSGLRELEQNLHLLKNDEALTREQISAFPTFNPATIRKNARECCKILKSTSFKAVQEIVNRCIRIIKVGNETVETVIDTQALLNSYLPLGISIIEKRDNIARPENHSFRAFNFATLTVKVG